MTSAALCELCIDAGRESALQAIGICEECGRAFCRSHRARTRYEYNIPGYGDWCSACMAAWKAAKVGKARAEADQKNAEMARITELVQLLDRSVVQPVVRSESVRRLKKGILGKKYIDVREPIEPAWPVGELKWKSPGSWEYGPEFSMVASGITRKLEIVQMSGSSGAQRPFYGFSREILDGHSVLERSETVRRQVIDALERLVQTA